MEFFTLVIFPLKLCLGANVITSNVGGMGWGRDGKRKGRNGKENGGRAKGMNKSRLTENKSPILIHVSCDKQTVVPFTLH